MQSRRVVGGHTTFDPFFCWRIRSINQGDWRYGRFEIRAKLPTGQGLWPAIWMMPTDAVYGSWPGSPDHTTEFPQQMVVDYVRVYQDTEAEPKTSLPLIFEDLYFNWEDAFTGFDGGSVTVVDNPDPDDVNSTSRVGRMVKDGGAYWGGA